MQSPQNVKTCYRLTQTVNALIHCFIRGLIWIDRNTPSSLSEKSAFRASDRIVQLLLTARGAFPRHFGAGVASSGRIVGHPEVTLWLTLAVNRENRWNTMGEIVILPTPKINLFQSD